MQEFNVDSIIARLKNGESEESIANSLTDALNSAILTVKAEEEESKAQIKLEHKMTDFANILNGVADFIVNHYIDENDTETAECIINAFDFSDEDLVDCIKKLDEAMNNFKLCFPLIKDLEDTFQSKKLRSKPEEYADAVIDKFLKIMNW